MNNEKLKKIALITAIVFSVLSFIAVFIAYILSGKNEQLYKAGLPLVLVLLNVFLYKKMFAKNQ